MYVLVLVVASTIVFYLFHRKYGRLLEEQHAKTAEKRKEKEKAKEDVLTFKF